MHDHHQGLSVLIKVSLYKSRDLVLMWSSPHHNSVMRFV